jgi:hypothetical protein
MSPPCLTGPSEHGVLGRYLVRSEPKCRSWNTLLFRVCSSGERYAESFVLDRDMDPRMPSPGSVSSSLGCGGTLGTLPIGDVRGCGFIALWNPAGRGYFRMGKEFSATKEDAKGDRIGDPTLSAPFPMKLASTEGFDGGKGGVCRWTRWNHSSGLCRWVDAS